MGSHAVGMTPYQRILFISLPLFRGYELTLAGKWMPDTPKIELQANLEQQDERTFIDILRQAAATIHLVDQVGNNILDCQKWLKQLLQQWDGQKTVHYLRTQREMRGIDA